MKRWPIVAASIAGAAVGFWGTVYAGSAIGLGTSLTTTETDLLVVLCPPIYLMWWGWWLVPIVNALLYAGIAFGITKWQRSKRKPTGLGQ